MGAAHHRAARWISKWTCRVPKARLQFADAGLELLVRYPVELRRAPDTDEDMTRGVLDLIAKDETLKTAVSGTPKIRSAIRG